MHNIYCGGLTSYEGKNSTDFINLNIGGEYSNINFEIANISYKLLANIPDELADLIEISAYVYCADQKIKRGGETLKDMGDTWVRNLHFHIPVRCLSKWQSDELMPALKEGLGFLSDDNYTFKFYQKENHTIKGQKYLPMQGGGFTPDKVCLFSGGLDSLAGIVEDIVSNNKKLVLVSHYSSPKVYNVQKTIIEELNKKGFAKQIYYVPVQVNKVNIESDTKEYTQRTRSFLFACLAVSVSHLFGKNDLCFYENGVVSLNLPISSDVLGARATRTTHPRVMRGFERIFSLLLDKEVKIDTPLQWNTKAETISLLDKNNLSYLIEKTNSCTRPHIWTTMHTHCGVCSQCIDRRFAVFAAGLEKCDPAEKYKYNLMLGSRDTGRDIVMATSFVAFAQNISEISISGFMKEFPQVFDVIGYYNEPEPINKIYEMLQRHANDVNNVIKKAIEINSNVIARGELPPKSLLSMITAGAKEVEIIETKNVADQIAKFMDDLSEVPCEFVVDDDNKQVIFTGGLILKGTEYSLIKLLLPNFIAAKNSGIDGEAVNTEKLIKEIFGSNEISFRKMLSRINKKVAEEVGLAMGITFGQEDFIENIFNKGYRINKSARLLSCKSDLKLPESNFVTS
ncbi:7-cyano-7-deazaguanine synthase [Rickettsiales bacterium]|nr:7-cyano-7-deazaguanine synthase [Rickettsiales bacterium]